MKVAEVVLELALDRGAAFGAEVDLNGEPVLEVTSSQTQEGVRFEGEFLAQSSRVTSPAFWFDLD